MLIETLFSHPILYFRIILIVILSVSLHELAHGLVAINQGDDTPQKSGHLTLNPVVHMGWDSIIFLVLTGMAWGAMPVNPSRFRHPKLSNILVSAAGPVSNLVLSLLFIVLLNLDLPVLSREFLYLGASLNLVLFMFNLIPIPPLDGFRVASELLPNLKVLDNNPFGFFLLMIIFTSDLSSGLFAISRMAIETISSSF